MAIQDIDTTQITEFCDNCASTQVVTLASLEAGTDDSRDVIRFPECVACGTQWYYSRTFPIAKNSQIHSKVINGLHRFLVDTLAQTNPNQTAALNAETENDKPQFFLEPTASLLTIRRGLVNGEFGHDAIFLKAIHGEARAKDLINRGVVIVDSPDPDIGSAVQDLFGAGSEGDAAFTSLKLDRQTVFGS